MRHHHLPPPGEAASLRGASNVRCSTATSGRSASPDGQGNGGRGDSIAPQNVSFHRDEHAAGLDRTLPCFRSRSIHRVWNPEVRKQLLLLPGAGNNTAWLFLQAIHVNNRMHRDNTPACCCHASAAARTSLHTQLLFSRKMKTLRDKGGRTLKGFLRARLRIPESSNLLSVHLPITVLLCYKFNAAVIPILLV